MTQQSTSTSVRPDGLAGTLQDLRQQSAAAVSSLPDTFRTIWRDHQEWVWIAIPLAIVSFYAYAITWMSWFGYDKILFFQPFVPLAVAYAIWRDRHVVMLEYQDATELYVPDSHRRHGNLLPMFIGCVVLLGGAVTTVTTLSIFGLVIMLISGVYYLYGWQALRIAIQPLLYLVFLIPPPLAWITWLTQKLQLGSALVASQILQMFFNGTHVQGIFIMLPNYVLEVSAPCSGVSIIFPVCALTAFLALFKRMHLSWTGILLVASLAIAVAMNVLRIVVMGLIGGFSPDTATFLHDSNSMIFAALSFYLVFLLAGRIERGPRRRLSEFERDLAAAAYAADDYRDGQEQAR